MDPRVYAILATRAPIAAVFRRGPTNWMHIGRWDLVARRYEPGAWLGGRIFPRRSDLSPDGQFLCYFAHKPSATWEHGEAYVAISRLPWLTALHAFGTCGTWTRGFHFTDDPRDSDVSEPPPIPFGLRATRALQFTTERRRGWEEAPDSPPRLASDHWDQHRHARVRKPQPGVGRWLCAEHLDTAVDDHHVAYWLESDGDLLPLDDVQWADWSADGLLLTATRRGVLQMREVANHGFTVTFEADLAALAPEPTPSPDWARRW